MTDNEKARFSRDLKKYSGGFEPLEIISFGHKNWSVSFGNELAALRVANKYRSEHVYAVQAGGDPSIWIVRSHH
jgi:hypothetical protein